MRTHPSPEHPRHERLWHLVEQRTDTADIAHDALHVLRVYDWAIKLAPEACADPDLTGAAALVHDLVNIPKEHRDRPLGSERSAEASRGLLDEAGYDPKERAVIVEAVRTCSWSRGLDPTNEVGMVLQDADRIDALGSVGIAAQAMSSRGQPSRFYHPEDPMADTSRTLDDSRQPVDHFFAKLLKLAATMHTETGKAEGLRRHRRMEQFLANLMEEIT
jgi:uncharacterized protein